MKFTAILISFFTFSSCHASDSTYTIKINFLYGSRPARGYLQQESKRFGGIKGGNVNIAADGRVLDFRPENNPLLPNNKKPSGGFSRNGSVYWNSETDKWTTVIVPVSQEQFIILQKLIESFAAKTPYDYAIFGMRCAAASYDVLSQIGLFKEYPNTKNVATHFYPKLLRKKVLKWADKNNYAVISHNGRSTRKWESDKGLL